MRFRRWSARAAAPSSIPLRSPGWSVSAVSALTRPAHGVVGLTRTAALDYIGQGVRINAVCPGATRTRILANWFQDPKVESFILSRHPIGRVAEPEEIARAVLFLASDDASFIVGQALAVDGGLTAQ